MHNGQEIKSAIESFASDPKVASIVAAGSTTAGAVASNYEILDGWISRTSMIVGIATAIVVFAIQLIRLEQAIRGRRQKKQLEGQ